LRHTTLPDFIYKIKDLEINLRDDFICDSQKPEAIEEMRRNGINSKSVKKGTILHGIDLIKRHNLFVTPTSINLINELNSYIWKQDKNLKNLDEPIDNFNHCIDPIRYILEMKIGKKQKKFAFV
jgi:phage terminase large subunit